MMVGKNALGVALIACCVATVRVNAQEGEEILAFKPVNGTVSQAATVLEIDPGCSFTAHTPNTMFTVEVASTVTVTSTPEDLVTVDLVEDNKLVVTWRNPAGVGVDDLVDKNKALGSVQGAAKNALSGNLTDLKSFGVDDFNADQSSGVKIGFPAGKLNSVIVASELHVQIKGGFTDLYNLAAKSGSKVRADLKSVTKNIGVTAEEKSELNVTAGGDVMVTANNQALVNAETTMAEVTAERFSTVNILGNVGGGKIDGKSTLSVSGTVEGLKALDGSDVKAHSCSGVDTNPVSKSTCTEETPTIVVDVSEQPETLKGLNYCVNDIVNDIKDKVLSYFCIGGGNKLWSCTKNESVFARDVQIGDSVRVATTATVGDDSTSTSCSDVYYVFRHEEEANPAIRFHVGNDDDSSSSFDVSYNHIVYVGESYGDRRPVLSQDVKNGDKLVTSNSKPVEVVKIEASQVDLVNVLTLEPNLEIQMEGGDRVVVSAHTYDEYMYGVLFAPVKYVYLTFGAKAVEYMKPMFDLIDSYSSSFLGQIPITMRHTTSGVRGVTAQE